MFVSWVVYDPSSWYILCRWKCLEPWDKLIWLLLESFNGLYVDQFSPDCWSMIARWIMNHVGLWYEVWLIRRTDVWNTWVGMAFMCPTNSFCKDQPNSSADSSIIYCGCRSLIDIQWIWGKLDWMAASWNSPKHWGIMNFENFRFLISCNIEMHVWTFKTADTKHTVQLRQQTTGQQVSLNVHRANSTGGQNVLIYYITMRCPASVHISELCTCPLGSCVLSTVALVDGECG